MTRTLAALLLGVVCTAPLPAQTPCPPGDINRLEGAWRHRPFPQYTAPYRPAAGTYDRAAANRTLDSILAVFRAAFPQPIGTNAYYDRDVTFSTSDRGVPFGYSLSIAFGGFYCVRSETLHEYTESGVFINVEVNRFSSASLVMPVTAPSVSTREGDRRLNAVDADDPQYTIGGRRVFVIPAAHGSHRGVDYYSANRYSRDADPPDWQWFVIRKPDVPLLIPVTRREYVPQFRRELTEYTEQEIANLVHRARVEGDPSAATFLPVFARGQAAYLQAIDDYLATAGDAELARPVSEPLMLLPRDSDRPRVEFRDGDRVMAVINPAYLDTTRPHHVPQFIVVQLSARATRYPWESALRERFATALDFDALRAMLGR